MIGVDEAEAGMGAAATGAAADDTEEFVVVVETVEVSALDEAGAGDAVVTVVAFVDSAVICAGEEVAAGVAAEVA